MEKNYGNRRQSCYSKERMLKEELKSEAIYVLTIFLIIIWAIMLIDIQHRWRTQEQRWEYVITVEPREILLDEHLLSTSL